MVGTGVGNANLFVIGLEIGVSDFYGDTTRHFISKPELVTQGIYHSGKGVPESLDIYCIKIECALIGD